ncbi:MAG: hypothetical protein LC731_05215 [Acidobacteria bacterium]|nr:hypothetical protein [Acidobacteriota bacterium]
MRRWPEPLLPSLPLRPIRRWINRSCSSINRQTATQRRAEEGDAYSRKSLEEIGRQERERFNLYRKEVGQFFPPLLIETFSFRYRDGARFVEEVRRKNGERGVNELFARPPSSSEQVLHPDKYFQNEGARTVGLDEAAFNSNGWRLVTSTPLGEIGARGVLMAGNSETAATRAAAGWDGDRAFLFERNGGGSLFVWKTLWDRTGDAEEFFRAYNDMVKQRTGTTQAGSQSQGDVAQTIWRDSSRLLIVRREGTSVIVVRGTEADAGSSLELARR